MTRWQSMTLIGHVSHAGPCSWPIHFTGLLTALIALSCTGSQPGTRITGPEPDPLIAMPDTTIFARSVGRTFQGASRMSVSPDGEVFVADALASHIVRFRINQSTTRSLGAPGSAPGELFEPRDVESSSGLFIWVADTGNGRIQRFSARGGLIEILPVPRGNDAYAEPPQPVFQPEGNPGRGSGSSGRPIAISVSPTDDLHILEEISGAVLWTDRQRREWRVTGGANAGEGRLQQAVDLTYHEGRLFVADARSASIRTYDAFGSYLGHMGRGLLPGIVRVHASREGVLAVLPTSLVAMDLEGHTLRKIVLMLSSANPERGEREIVDATWLGDRLLLLTQTELFVSGS